MTYGLPSMTFAVSQFWREKIHRSSPDRLSLSPSALAHDSKMGIKQLTKMIGDSAPDAIKARTPSRTCLPAKRSQKVGHASEPLCPHFPNAARGQFGRLHVSRNAGGCSDGALPTAALGSLRHPECAIWLILADRVCACCLRESRSRPSGPTSGVRSPSTPP